MSKIFIISGTAGSGKGSVWAPLINKPDQYYIVKSCTTRKKRSDSKDESKYKFVPLGRFDELVKRNKFIEYENVHGNLYGTLKGEINKGKESGKIVIMEIDVKGALSVRKKIANAVLIFIKPSNINEAKKRLRDRKTEGKKAIKKRIERYNLELALSKKFDHIIINDDLKKAQSELGGIIKEENGERRENW